LGSAVVERQVSQWRGEHVAAISSSPAQTIALIDPASVSPAIAGLDLWDMWPVQLIDGSTARFEGWTLWMVLSAPLLPDPDQRHGIARIRLITEKAGEWRDCGDALPDGINPGSRDWAGSALYDPASSALTLFFTAAGYRGEAQSTFAQRLFQTTGSLAMDNGTASVSGWSAAEESFPSDGNHYLVVTQSEGIPGFIKGFRDPAHFRDPADGSDYLFFTGSLQQSDHAFNGCIGAARSTDGQHRDWQILPPLLSADGLNNEQERPHVIHHGGLYYLFWSTQRKVFAPGGPSGPNGLYAAVATTLQGPWKPVNGTGLVAANPDEAPFQTYSWWVTADLEVAGFIDLTGTSGEVVDDPAWRRAHFGGTPAPRFRIVLDGERASVVA